MRGWQDGALFINGELVPVGNIRCLHESTHSPVFRGEPSRASATIEVDRESANAFIDMLNGRPSVAKTDILVDASNKLIRRTIEVHNAIATGMDVDGSEASIEFACPGRIRVTETWRPSVRTWLDKTVQHVRRTWKGKARRKAVERARRLRAMPERIREM